MTARKALGRGLDALIPSSPAKNDTDLVSLEIDKIRASHLQPRQVFNKKALEELAESIKAQGVLQPVLVRAAEGEPGMFELIAGERRFRASKMAGLARVPALIKNVTEREALAISLLENLQREDLDPIEAAKGYERLIREFGSTQDELAQKIGKDRSTIANSLRLLKLPEEIQAELQKGKLTAGHARALLALDNPAKIKILFRRILELGLNVRQAEALSRKMQEQAEAKPKKGKPAADNRIFIEEVERNLERAVSAKVRIVESGKNRGKIEIYYHNLDELEKIIELVSRKR